ncbi:MAG: TrkA C-terminal domain-containing protein [Deltaproteobacteria bacterium]|nr:TrkA C-terminal domain-containing protein [Deltaproteobacteria bacterium]
MQLSLPKSLDGKTLAADNGARKKHGITAQGICRGSQFIPHPAGDPLLDPDDVLLFISVLRTDSAQLPDANFKGNNHGGLIQGVTVLNSVIRMIILFKCCSEKLSHRKPRRGRPWGQGDFYANSDRPSETHDSP